MQDQERRARKLAKESEEEVDEPKERSVLKRPSGTIGAMLMGVAGKRVKDKAKEDKSVSLYSGEAR